MIKFSAILLIALLNPQQGSNPESGRYKKKVISKPTLEAQCIDKNTTNLYKMLKPKMYTISKVQYVSLILLNKDEKKIEK
tara:strand:- start:419 stop:658 length:240 start_codon:yes stop_codon:yes gene_type:complete